MRRGVTEAALEIGSVINIEGVRARDGSNNDSARRITFADRTMHANGVEMSRRLKESVPALVAALAFLAGNSSQAQDIPRTANGRT